MACLLLQDTPDNPLVHLVPWLLSYWYVLLLLFFFYYVALCAAVGHIADQKGHSNWQWALMAAVFNPFVAILFLLVAPTRPSAWSTDEGTVPVEVPSRRDSTRIFVEPNQ